MGYVKKGASKIISQRNAARKERRRNLMQLYLSIEKFEMHVDSLINYKRGNEKSAV